MKICLIVLSSLFCNLFCTNHTNNLTHPFPSSHQPIHPFFVRPVHHSAWQDPPTGDLRPQLGQDDSLVEGVERGVRPLCEEFQGSAHSGHWGRTGAGIVGGWKEYLLFLRKIEFVCFKVDMRCVILVLHSQDHSAAACYLLVNIIFFLFPFVATAEVPAGVVWLRAAAFRSCPARKFIFFSKNAFISFLSSFSYCWTTLTGISRDIFCALTHSHGYLFKYNTEHFVVQGRASFHLCGRAHCVVAAGPPPALWDTDCDGPPGGQLPRPRRPYQQLAPGTYCLSLWIRLGRQNTVSPWCFAALFF